LNNESDIQPVSYGSMLIEGLLAIIALITAITIVQSHYEEGITAGGPIGIFSSGIGAFVSTIGIPVSAGVTFAALAISAFAMTTLDTATRLGRFMFQEIFDGKGPKNILSGNRYIGTLVTIGVSMLLTFTGTRDSLWPLFGTANQLLASLSLLTITVWMAKLKKKNGIVKYPMYFMFAVTLTALGFQIYSNAFGENPNILLVLVSLLLSGVAITLVIHAIRSLKTI
jgi:carbon starvation protein